MRHLQIATEEIGIKPLGMEMFRELKYPFAEGEPVYDITFENFQAGLGTDMLFRAANQREGLFENCSMSELALGRGHLDVGAHMSRYNVNAALPKTLIHHLIRWGSRRRGQAHCAIG